MDDELSNAPLFLIDLVLEWVEEICHYLTNELPTDRPLDMARATRLISDASPYQLIARQLYKQGKDGIICRCIIENEFVFILNEAHLRIVGGHLASKITA